MGWGESDKGRHPANSVGHRRHSVQEKRCSLRSQQKERTKPALNCFLITPNGDYSVMINTISSEVSNL